MDTFLTIVFVFLLVIYLLPLVFRFLGPLLLKWAMKYMMKKAGIKNGTPFGNPPQKEGEISFGPFQKPEKKTKPDKSKGEYVDYEEIA